MIKSWRHYVCMLFDATGLRLLFDHVIKYHFRNVRQWKNTIWTVSLADG